MINKDVRKSLACKNVNDILIHISYGVVITYRIRSYLIRTLITKASVGYRLIVLIIFFGVTGGITVGVIIIIHAQFAFIKRPIDHY